MRACVCILWLIRGEKKRSNNNRQKSQSEEASKIDETREERQRRQQGERQKQKNRRGHEKQQQPNDDDNNGERTTTTITAPLPLHTKEKKWGQTVYMEGRQKANSGKVPLAPASPPGHTHRHTFTLQRTQITLPLKC